MNVTPPIEIAAWLGCLAFTVMLVNGVLRIADRMRDKPSGGEVRGEVLANFVPKPEFVRHVEENRREHENIFGKIGGVERGALNRMDALSKEWRTFTDQKVSEIVESNERGREKIHERINDVLAAVSELRGQMKR